MRGPWEVAVAEHSDAGVRGLQNGVLTLGDLHPG